MNTLFDDGTWTINENNCNKVYKSFFSIIQGKEDTFSEFFTFITSHELYRKIIVEYSYIFVICI